MKTLLEEEIPKWNIPIAMDELMTTLELPADLAKIPEDSEMGTVLYAVPGTDVAKEAVLDAKIPQTATVCRKKATLTVEYDGEPNFETITVTTMVYGINTATPIIRLDGNYLLCLRRGYLVCGEQRQRALAGGNFHPGYDLYHPTGIPNL